MSISSPHGRSVGLPKSSWLNQFPQRPIPWASSTPGAPASKNAQTLSPERCTTIAAAIAPPMTAPQMPRPPSQISKMPCHLGASTSLHDVITW